MMITSKRLKWAVPAGAVALLLALTAACGGDDNKGASPSATESSDGAVQQFIMGQPAPTPNLGDIPATYDPQPGDLLFYTNASISYNSQARHPWVVIVDAKTKKILAGSEIPEVLTSPHGIGLSPDATKIYLPAGSAQPNFVQAGWYAVRGRCHRRRYGDAEDDPVHRHYRRSSPHADLERQVCDG
jgi:hypothetical protein